MNEKTDLRVIKTRNLLYNTLLDLLKDYPFEKIKVSDICNKAKINRSTFYSHYNDKYELMVDFMNNLKYSLVEQLEKNNYNYSLNTKEYYLEMIRLLLDYIEEKKQIYQFALVNNENSLLVEILENTIINDITNTIGKNKVAIPSDIISKFYVGGVVSIVVSWLKGNIKYSKKEILEYFSKLIPSDL